jgi:hypothetical protein
MPAQQRLWRDDQPLPASSCWEHSSERREEGTIGRAKRRPPLLPPEHDQLMSEYEQFDLSVELAAPASDKQPEQS